MRRVTDVMVIGGGPAGLAAAIASRKKGFEVTVADGAKPPTDKACGEGLMPNTLPALGEIGVTIGPGDGRFFRGIRFLDGTTSVEANFPQMSGIGVRRTVLHQKMVKRAEESGVTLLWNTPVTGVAGEGVHTGGGMIRANWVIGADGIQSRVRRWTGLDSNTRQDVRFAHRRHYFVKPWTDRMEIHWGPRMQAYVTPLANEEVCVVLISRDPYASLENAWREFPRLASSLVGAELSSAERGAITATHKLPRVYRGNVALVGDASGSVDAITGEGLCLSFRQAIALADALEAGHLEMYQEAHRRFARRPYITGRLLLLLDHSVAVRRRALRALTRDPDLFVRLLAIHVDKASPTHFAVTGLRLGWQLLLA
jgi:flavin-dependent dehydrogenase